MKIYFLILYLIQSLLIGHISIPNAFKPFSNVKYLTFVHSMLIVVLDFFHTLLKDILCNFLFSPCNQPRYFLLYLFIFFW